MKRNKNHLPTSHSQTEATAEVIKLGIEIYKTKGQQESNVESWKTKWGKPFRNSYNHYYLVSNIHLGPRRRQKEPMLKHSATANIALLRLESMTQCLVHLNAAGSYSNRSQ